MPVYDYKCKKCGRVFEYKQSMKDEPLKKCLESVCEEEVKGQGDVSRVFSSNVGLVFKGSGFYLTDYGKGKNGASKNNETSKSNGTETKKETPAKKTEAKAKE